MLATSPEAKYIQDQIAKHNRFLHESAAIGMENLIREELADVWEECHQPNWDGYDALQVKWDTYNNTERFLLALPLGMRTPSIGAEPDGHLTLEWYHSPRRTLSVSISPDDELNYAALLGPGRFCGTEPFFDEVPKMILDLINRVYSC